MSDAGDAPPPPLGPRTAATQVSAVVQAFRSSHGTISRSPTTVQTPAPSQVGWRYRRCRRRKPGRPVRTHVGEQQSPAIVFAVIALLGRIEVRDDRLRTALQRDEQVKRIALLLPAGPHARREAAPILLTAQASGTRAGAQSRQPCEVVSMKGCPPPRYGSQRTGLPGDARRDARLRHDSRAYAAGAETVLGGGGKRGPETELADDAFGHGDSRRARGVVRSTARGITRCAPPPAPRVDRGVLRARRGRWA